uniref:Uncharacterized protein n=1 Tax=Romanomermis culicivorax TaxID=13658 RepID=A0A915I0L4_ROMCU
MLYVVVKLDQSIKSNKETKNAKGEEEKSGFILHPASGVRHSASENSLFLDFSSGGKSSGNPASDDQSALAVARSNALQWRRSCPMRKKMIRQLIC